MSEGIRFVSNNTGRLLSTHCGRSPSSVIRSHGGADGDAGVAEASGEATVILAALLAKQSPPPPPRIEFDRMRNTPPLIMDASSTTCARWTERQRRDGDVRIADMAYRDGRCRAGSRAGAFENQLRPDLGEHGHCLRAKS